MINHNFLFLLVFCVNCDFVYGQNAEWPKYVNVPSEAAVLLDSAYDYYFVNASAHVRNILEPSNLSWGNGVYCYHGQGPHFPEKIFIVNKDDIYVFNNYGSWSPKELIEEFLSCAKKQNLDSKDTIR